RVGGEVGREAGAPRTGETSSRGDSHHHPRGGERGGRRNLELLRVTGEHAGHVRDRAVGAVLQGGVAVVAPADHHPVPSPPGRASSIRLGRGGTKGGGAASLARAEPARNSGSKMHTTLRRIDSSRRAVRCCSEVSVWIAKAAPRSTVRSGARPPRRPRGLR